jgi:diguanylate cyclase (GGDEF)-like protein/PAS domain S-box-containing protein
MFKNISAKNKTLLFVVTTLIVFSIVLIGTIYINQKNKLGNLEKEYYNNLKNSYEKILERHKSFYEFRLRANIKSKGVKEAFAARDRDELLSLIEGRWGVLQNENPYLQIMHFHLPNGESFLRVHKQEKYGDNIASRRVMAAAMHKEKRPLYGFEAGIYMLAYRTFLPIFYNDKYIGAVEFGSRPDQILHEMNYYNNIEGALFVRDDKIIEYKEKSDFSIGHYKLQYTTLEDPKLIKEYAKNHNLENDTTFEMDGRYYAVYIFDLSDYKGKSSVKAVFFHDITAIKVAFKNTVKQLLVLIAGLLALLILAINLGFKNIIDTLEKTNHDLDTNKNFINSILENSAHAIIASDPKGTITLFNKRAQDMLGYSSKELVGKSTPEIFHKKSQVIQRAKSYSKELNIDIQPGFEVFIAKSELGLENSDEWIYITKDNKELTVSLHVTKLIDFENRLIGYLAMAEDITESKQKERLLNEYIKLIDKNIITSSTDLDGNITYVSKAFCDISGYSKDELMGKNHRIIRHPDMLESTYQSIWSVITNDDTWEGEIKNLKKDGNFYWVKASISPIFDEQTNKIGYTAIRQDITDKKIIEEISITDGLTNIYNRRHFNELFPKMIEESKEQSDILCFLIMDIDHFKQYNDTYGHQMGDDVLIKVASAIKKSLKSENDNCFRLGGEEFGLLFRSTDAKKALEFANMVRESIESLEIEHSGNSASSYVSASMGLVCKVTNDTYSDDEIYKTGDDLLYEAKESGRNRVCSKNI